MTGRRPRLAELNLNLLVTLDTLIETRSVRRSAQRLGVTQSAMSHALRQLRELFGDALLTRSGNDMLLTPRAERLAGPLRETLARMQHLVSDEERFVPLATTRRFFVGASDVAAMTVLPALSRTFEAEAPHAELAVAPLDAEQMPAHLEAGRTDLLVSPSPPKAAGLRTRALYRSGCSVLVRRDHPEVGELLDLDTYCRLSHVAVVVSARVAAHLDAALERRGRARRVAVSVPYFLAAPALAATTDHLVTVPSDAAPALAKAFSLRVLPLPLAGVSITVSMTWHERFDDDPALVWLRDAVVRATEPLRERERAGGEWLASRAS